MKSDMKKTDIVTFGEIMMRLSPEKGERFYNSGSLDVFYGGAEANVAILSAGLGMTSRYVTKLPDTPIGRAAFYAIKKSGVNTDNIIFGDERERLGIYFLDPGVSQRPSKVVYDRRGSSFALAKASEYDWESILDGAGVFHITGITPALGEEAYKASLEAVRTAKRLGVSVSVDINYRAKLWGRERAAERIGALLEGADICFTNTYQADRLFDTSKGVSEYESREGFIFAAENICRKFGVKEVGFTRRVSHSADRNDLSAVYYKNGELGTSGEYCVEVMDRVGGGDAFAAGALFARSRGAEPSAIAQFGIALSVLCHTVKGDNAIFNEDEVNEIVRSRGGMIQR